MTTELDPDGRDGEEGEVSEVDSFPDEPEPIQPDQATAGSPDDISGDADEGTAGPNAKPEVTDD